MQKTVESTEVAETAQDVVTTDRKALAKVLLLKVVAPALAVVVVQVTTALVVKKLTSKTSVEA